MRIVATYETPKFCNFFNSSNIETNQNRFNFDGFESSTIYASDLIDLKQQVESISLQKTSQRGFTRPLKLSDLTIRISD
jgi:hypothetical protein